MAEAALVGLANSLHVNKIKELGLGRNDELDSEAAGNALAQVLSKMPDLEKVRPAHCIVLKLKCIAACALHCFEGAACALQMTLRFPVRLLISY